MKPEIAPYASRCYELLARTIHTDGSVFVVADSDGDGKTSYGIFTKAYEAIGGNPRNLHFSFGPLRDISFDDMRRHSVIVSLDNYLSGDGNPVLQRLFDQGQSECGGIEGLILVDHHPLGEMGKVLQEHDPLRGGEAKPHAYVIHPETVNEVPGYSTCSAVLTYQLAMAMLYQHFNERKQHVTAWHRAHSWLLVLGMYSDGLPRSPDTPYGEIMGNPLFNRETVVRLSYALNMRRVDTTEHLLRACHLGDAASRIFSHDEFQRADQMMRSWYQRFQGRNRERNKPYFCEESFGNGTSAPKVVFGLLYDSTEGIVPRDLSYSFVNYVTLYRLHKGRVADFQDFNGTVIFFQPKLVDRELVFSIEARSSDVDVGKLMQRLGGGGHIRAAGATSHTQERNISQEQLPVQIQLEFDIRKIGLLEELKRRRREYEVASS
ncbi:hypothetical protein HYW21_04060 [Candidatus Woesearchaeota archaeon]|nr:hypothetical protein [Candidatus Woesearchaeota archaeon]